VERTEQADGTAREYREEGASPHRSGDKAQRIYTTLLSDTGLPLGRTAHLQPKHRQPIRAVFGQPGDQSQPSGFRTCGRPKKVRAALRDSMPGTQLYFFIGGIVKRIQNFGATAPIDVEVLGYDLDDGSRYGSSLLTKMRGLTARAGSAIADGCPVVARREQPGAGRGGGPPEGRHAGRFRAGRSADHPDQPAWATRNHASAVYRSQDRQTSTMSTYAWPMPTASTSPDLGDMFNAHARRRNCDGGTPLARIEAQQRSGHDRPQVFAAHRTRHGQRRAHGGFGRGQRSGPARG